MWLIDLALTLQLFVLINPLSSFPVLIDAYKSKMNVRQIALFSVIIAFIVAIVIIFIGPYLFQLFGISLDSFRIAGGIILLLLGINTINKEKERRNVDKVDSLISIIATPLLTGPATISFLIIEAYDVGYYSIVASTTLAFILVAIVFMIFAFSIKKVNEKIVIIAAKVFGLFLMAIAIEMIAKGILNILSAKPV